MHTRALIGHDALLARLGDATDRDGLHHAMLFEGPPGVGKHTIALHIARSANCLHDDPAERPCDACRSCTSIASGAHPDVMVVEPDVKQASGKIPIDTIREVVRKAQYHRYGSRRRFIVIDPTEAMAAPAANALLKTLEEPPDGTGFILIATTPKALLPTIISRCQRVRFGPVPHEALTGWLASRGVADAEQIATASMGCPGVAVDLAGGTLVDRHAVRDQVIAVLEGDLDGLFKYTQKLASGNRASWRKKAEALFEVLEELLRDAAVVATGSTTPLVNSDIQDVVQRYAAVLWPGGVERCQRALMDARLDLERMVSGRTALDALLCTIREELGMPSSPSIASS